MEGGVPSGPVRYKWISRHFSMEKYRRSLSSRNRHERGTSPPPQRSQKAKREKSRIPSNSSLNSADHGRHMKTGRVRADWESGYEGSNESGVEVLPGRERRQRERQRRERERREQEREQEMQTQTSLETDSFLEGLKRRRSHTHARKHASARTRDSPRRSQPPRGRESPRRRQRRRRSNSSSSEGDGDTKCGKGLWKCIKSLFP